MSLFRLDASILPATSASRELGDLVEREWNNILAEAGVTRRDLATDPVPATLWRDAVTAGFAPEDARTDEQRDARALATASADELIASEALLFDVPLYNFGVSQQFKTWFDLVYTDPRTGPEGTALRGKPAILVTVQGGNYTPGSPREGWDHSTPWLRLVLADVWGLDLTVVERPFTLVGVNPAMDAFAEPAAAFRKDAEKAALRAGRKLAEDAASAS